jgi:quercetin 2,3-dioxygenase
MGDPTAQLYLADQRGYVPVWGGQRLHTLNAPGYVADDREPVGTLFLWSDDSLQAGATLTAIAEQDTELWWLPITGGLEYQIDATHGFLEPGQAGRLMLPAGTSYAVSNPYPSETINFLQIGLATQVRSDTSAFRAGQFDPGQRNVLQPLFAETDTALIGCYDGREEGLVAVNEGGGHYFVFVIAGAFEVANHLLHPRDGLALHYAHAADLDFEALSNEAILLFIRLKLRASGNGG